MAAILSRPQFVNLKVDMTGWTQIIVWGLYRWLWSYHCLALSHQYTVCCRYNTVNFLKKNIHKGHPIARPLGRAMGCLLWIQYLIDILPEFLQLFMQYLTILDRVITLYSAVSYDKMTIQILIYLCRIVPEWTRTPHCGLQQNLSGRAVHAIWWQQLRPSAPWRWQARWWWTQQGHWSEKIRMITM